MSELGVQKPGLDRVQPTVVAFYVMVVLLRLSVITQQPDSVGDTGIIRGYRPGFATRSEVFARIETKRGCPTHRAGLHPSIVFLGKVFRTVCLTCILDHCEAILLA